jgi:hypothetical protein
MEKDIRKIITNIINTIKIDNNSLEKFYCQLSYNYIAYCKDNPGAYIETTAKIKGNKLYVRGHYHPPCSLKLKQIVFNVPL